MGKDDKYFKERGEAQKHIQKCRIRMKPAIDALESFDNFKYWDTGYRIASMCGLGSVCIVAGSRYPSVLKVGSWVALLGGYYAGGVVHRFHRNTYVYRLVNSIDENLAELEEAQRAHPYIYEYSKEIQIQKNKKFDLVPHTVDPALEPAGGISTTKTMEELVDLIIERYESKKHNLK